MKPRSYVVSRLYLWYERRGLASAAAAPCMLMARRPSLSDSTRLTAPRKNSPQDCFYAQTLSASSPARNKKESLLRLFFIWCERRDLASAAAAPCMLMARRPSLSDSTRLTAPRKNSPQDCFYAQTLSASSPARNKKESLLRLFFIWCERRDLASAAAAPCMLMARRPSLSDSTRLTATR